jgi:predicted phage-related endonuclease
MTAEEVDADQDRWKQLRRKGVTATDIGSIMRVQGAYGGPARVYWSKVAGDEQPDTG